MSAADRIRRALDTVDPDASGNAAGYTEGDVAGLLDERDRLEAQLADERRDRAEVYRQHTGLTAELDRAHRDLSGARTTISRLELEAVGHVEEVRKLRGGAEVVIAQRNGRDRHIADLEQRIAAARAHLDAHDQPDGVGSLIDATIAILDGRAEQ